MKKSYRNTDGSFRWSDWIGRHFFALLFIHVVVTSGIILTGADLLEPLAASWFWAPAISFMLMPDGWEWGDWAHRHRVKFFWVGWTINAIVLPIVLWPILHGLDVEGLHPLREFIGRSIGLGGQTGLLILICSLAAVAGIAQELYCLRLERRQKRQW